jgi:hypothetical protein
MKNKPEKKNGFARNTKGLRDCLFDEIEELRCGNGDPTKSMAIANLAKQIINTAKVELDFHRIIAQQAAEGTPIEMGSLQLGTDAASVSKTATER